MINLSQLHQERSFFYSSLSFLRHHKEKLIENFLTNLNASINSNSLHSLGTSARCFFRYLEWDSEHLNIPTYRIEFCDWNEGIGNPLQALSQTFIELKEYLSDRHGSYYLFAEIPSEDIVTIQALNCTGLGLVETRLHYYYDNLSHYSWTDRYNVRQATIEDIPILRNVAIKARNRFDRLHADPLFSDSIADDYLGVFV